MHGFDCTRAVSHEAVKQNGMALQYAAEETSFRSMPKFACFSVQKPADPKRCQEMRVDREVVLEAVQQQGLALQYASAAWLLPFSGCWTLAARFLYIEGRRRGQTIKLIVHDGLTSSKMQLEKCQLALCGLSRKW